VHRKVVTVLFCDVVGSTSLGETIDPEAIEHFEAKGHVTGAEYARERLAALDTVAR
jgi:class 3 adenylate cyclase